MEDGCEIEISRVEECGGKTVGGVAPVASSASLKSVPVLLRCPVV